MKSRDSWKSNTASKPRTSALVFSVSSPSSDRAGLVAYEHTAPGSIDGEFTSTTAADEETRRQMGVAGAVQEPMTLTVVRRGRSPTRLVRP